MSDGPSGALPTTMLHLGQCVAPTPYGRFVVHAFRDLVAGRSAMVIVCGDAGGRSPLLTRVHSSCVTSECLGACDCDCAEQLHRALGRIGEAGRGVLFYLLQEGRGAGLTAKARDRMMVQASGNRLSTFEAFAELGLPTDLRRYDEVGPLARWLGIRAPLRLLTNNPGKAQAVERVLSGEGLGIETTEPLRGQGSPYNTSYLAAKQRSGHDLDGDPRWPEALAPEPVEIEPPTPAPDAPHLVSTASYLLPVALSAETATASRPPRAVAPRDVEWLRLRVVQDLRSGREWMLLARPGVGPAVVGAEEALVSLGLLDRLPTRLADGRRLLERRVRAMRAGAETPCVIELDETGGDVVGMVRDDRASRVALATEILAARWQPSWVDGIRSDVGS